MRTGHSLKDCDQLAEVLRTAAREHIAEGGQEQLALLAQRLHEITLPKIADVQSESKAVSERRLGMTILLIDHMNDSSSYLRKLRTWCTELSLEASILFRTRAGAVAANCAARGRVEHVYCMVEGEEIDRTSFVTRLRTQKLTSQDVKERKSQVLWESDCSWSDGEKKLQGNKFETMRYGSPEELRVCWERATNDLPRSAALEHFHKRLNTSNELRVVFRHLYKL